jgi:ethanolamine utilization protein EutA
LSISVGGQADANQLRALAKVMIRQLEASIGVSPKDGYYPMMLTLKDMPLPKQPQYLMFSGGVANIYYRDSLSDSDLFRYQDMGIILAQELRNSSFAKAMTILQPEETIRATVVGAGSHTANISGTTVTYDAAALPLKNVPVIRVGDDICPLSDQFATEIAQRIAWFDTEDTQQQLAVAFKGFAAPSFADVQTIANNLILGMRQIVSSGRIVIVVIQQDMAKVLGQTLKQQIANPVVCIDSVEVGEGDYIDIGNPIAGGMVLPVILKTLIFK